jgi:hypothetical protein
MKEKLKNYIRRDALNLTFQPLKSRGVDVSNFERRYDAREKLKQTLVSENRQYTSEESDKDIAETNADNAALLELIDKHF